MRPGPGAWERRLRAGRSLALALVAAASVFLGVRASGLGVEHDNQSLNTRDPSDLALHDAFKATFGSDDDLLVAIAHPRLLSPEGLGALAAIVERIEAMDGVRRAWSLVDAEEIVAGEDGPEPRALLGRPWDRDGFESMAAAALDRNPDFTGWLVSADRRVAGVVVELEERPGDVEYRTRLIEEIRALAPVVAGEGAELHLTGVPVQKSDVAAFVDADQRVLLPAAVVVLGITLAAFFRHPSGVAVPLGVAGLTVLWTTGLLAWTGHALNAITSLLPPVLLVVALATTVHVYDAWIGAAGDGGGRGAAPDDGARAAVAAVRRVLVPASLCALTTAQGFFSLSFGELPAVRQFGLFAAFGTLVSFLLAMTAVPAVLSWMHPVRRRPSDRHGWTSALLDACSGIAVRRPFLVLAAFGAVTLALVAGVPRVRANTDLVAFLREDAPLRRDTEWIDRNLTGPLPIDFVVRRGDGAAIVTPDGFAALEALEKATLEREHVAGVTSVLAILRQVERAASGRGLVLPADPDDLLAALDLLSGSGHDLVRRFAAPDMKTLRLTVRLHTVGSSVSLPLVRAVEADAARILGPVGLELVPTGSLWHVVRDSERLVREQVTSFGAAIVLVVASIGLLLRSWLFTALAMVPNVLPIAWTAGLMGWLGIELSTGTAMIASAVLGLVVDDTIHWLFHYRRLRRAGGESGGSGRASVAESIVATSRAVGAPVTVSSTSLVLGFWVGALGSFLPTIHFSLLTGLAMITGVACDLLVLPALLVLLDRDPGR